MEHLESDLHVASFLLVKGFRLLGLEQIGTRFSFKFEGSAGLADAGQSVHEYRQGALVSARDFAAAIQQLKGELYAAKYTKDGNGNDRNIRVGR